MKIILDLQGTQTESRFRGIGRYSLSLARAIARQSIDHDIYIGLNHAFPETLDHIRRNFLDLIEPDNVLVWQSLNGVAENIPDNRWRARASELIREQFFQKLRPDMVHISSLFEGFIDDATTSIGQFDVNLPTSVTLYDLIPLLNQEHYIPSSLHRQWYMQKLDSLKRADLLLAISESARQEALNALETPSDNIVTISTDADPKFQPILIDQTKEQKFRQRYGLWRDFVMCTGMIAYEDPRKNIKALIEAYSLLTEELRSQHQLVLVGHVPDQDLIMLEKYGHSLGLKNSALVFTGRVNDDDLLVFYNMCKLFVFPSLHEGFGLPVLEAMRCKAPVIGSDRSSIPEVVGLPAALFDATSVNSISLKMHQALSNEEFRSHLREHGTIQEKKFSWDISAKRALDAFELHFDKKQQGFKTQILLSRPSIVEQSQEPPSSLDNKRLDESGNENQDKTQSVLPYMSLISSIADIDISVPTKTDLAHVSLAIAENNPCCRKRQMLIDISELVHRDAKSGIQRVVRSVLNYLLNMPTQNFLVEPIYRKNGGYWYAREFTAKYLGIEEPRQKDSPIEVDVRDIYLGLDLDAAGYREVQQYLRHHRQRGIKHYIVIFDLLPILKPQFFPAEAYIVFKHWYDSIITDADGLVCISRSVSDELCDWLDQQQPQRALPLRIGYFHLGADVTDSRPTKGIQHSERKVLNALEGKTIFLMVGTIEPRKGHTQTLDAMERLWEQGEDVFLVIVGKQGWNVEHLISRIHEHPKNGNHLIWFSKASDELLLKLYDISTTVVMASEGEGFGLPLIEAAQHSLPIIARDLPVFREVAGENAFYFSAGDGDELAAALVNWLSLFRRDEHPTSTRMKWLTWEQSSQRLIDTILTDAIWYREWEPGYAIFQRPGSEFLHTLAGQLQDDKVVTTGREGFLIYGPWQPVKAGNYQLTISGKTTIPANGEARVEITRSKGEEIIWQSRLKSNDDNSYIANAEIFLSEDVKDLELRIWVNSYVEAEISSYRIRPINKQMKKLREHA